MSAILSLLILDQKLRKLRYYSAWFMYATIVIIGSLPGARAELGAYASGFILHSLAYAILTFLIFTGSTGSSRRRALAAVLTVVVMGAVDELIQNFFTYRGAAISDWLVDCSAAILAAALLWAMLPKSTPAP